MDALWTPIADAVMRPVYGDLLPDLDAIRDLGSLSGESYVDKDLRTLLHDPVRGPFNLRYCGNGSLDACRTSLWSAVDQVAASLAAAQGSADPAAWRSPASRTGFIPGLIPDTMRTTSRPTFQQALEFAPFDVGTGDGHPPCCRPPYRPHDDDHRGPDGDRSHGEHHGWHRY
jgi:hypothetical protein